MATRNIVPRADGEGGIGTSLKKWLSGYFGTINATNIVTSGLSFTGALNENAGSAISSASTINLTTATGNFLHITGTTTITAVTLGAGMRREVVFDGILTLTHHATNNNLPSSANITTAAGDRASYYSDGTTVYCTKYVKADGTPVVPGLTFASGAEAIAGTETGKVLSPATLRSGLNASGTAPVYACRAWVNFNGTGAVAIRASGNVSSITDNGTGDYTINFTTAMPDANYAIAGAGGTTANSLIGVCQQFGSHPQSTTACRIQTAYVNGTLIDASYVAVAVYR